MGNCGGCQNVVDACELLENTVQLVRDLLWVVLTTSDRLPASIGRSYGCDNGSTRDHFGHGHDRLGAGLLVFCSLGGGTTGSLLLDEHVLRRGGGHLGGAPRRYPGIALGWRSHGAGGLFRVFG